MTRWSVEIGRNGRIGGLEEAPELGGAMPSAAAAGHVTGGDIEGGEQGRRAMTLVVMAAPLGLADRERQERLGAIERLHLAFLVDAQNQGVIGRAHVEPDDIAHLVDDQWIGGQLEGLGAVRLQAERPPDALNTRGRDTSLTCHRPRAPMRGARWHGFQGCDDHGLDLAIADRGRHPGPRLVVKAVEPPGDEACPHLPSAA